MGLSMSRYGNDPIDFGPIDDDYRAFEPRDDETARGPLILALAAGVLIVFGAVVWNTYRQGVRTDVGALPLIASVDEDYKRRPDTQGGTQTPGLEHRIYDELDGSERNDELRRPVAAEGREALAGAPSDTPAGPMDIRPLSPDEAIDNEVADDADPVAEAQSDLAQMGALPRAGNGRASGQQIAALDEATAALAARAPVETAPQPTGTPSASAPRFSFDSSGPYLVQIAALRAESGALQTWDALNSRHPEIFNGAERRVQRADLGARGVFYRLRAGAFADRAGATEFCDAIKSTGNDCIVVQ